MFCCNVGSYRGAGCWKRISNMILDPSRSGQSQCNDGTDNDIRQCWQRCCHKWWQRWGQRCWQRMARFPIKLEFLIDFAEVHDEVSLLSWPMCDWWCWNHAAVFYADDGDYDACGNFLFQQQLTGVKSRSSKGAIRCKDPYSLLHPFAKQMTTTIVIVMMMVLL